MSEAKASHGIVKVYVAVSVDGFIATADGGVEWLNAFEAAGEDYGFDAMLAAVDTIVLGRTTYAQVLTFGDWPYPGQRTLVWTRSPLDAPAPPKTVAFSGDAAALAAELRRRCAAGDVWVNGGGRAVRGLLDAGAVDELDLFVMPRLLGAGVPLFPPGEAPATLALAEHRAWPSGVVRLRYRVAR